jgi:hypothetical protein
MRLLWAISLRNTEKKLKIALKDAYIDLGLSFEKFESRA